MLHCYIPTGSYAEVNIAIGQSASNYIMNKGEQTMTMTMMTTATGSQCRAGICSQREPARWLVR